MKKVFALCDPDTGEERYIGTTSYRIEDVLKETIYLAEKCWDESDPPQIAKPLAKWVRSLLEASKQPTTKLLEECEQGADISNRKRYWISQYPNLLNVRKW